MRYVAHWAVLEAADDLCAARLTEDDHLDEAAAMATLIDRRRAWRVLEGLERPDARTASTLRAAAAAMVDLFEDAAHDGRSSGNERLEREAGMKAATCRRALAVLQGPAA